MRRELAPWLSGRTVQRVHRVDAPLGPKTADLERAEGQRIEAVERRGKFLLLPLLRASAAGEDELIIHLGMTGVLSAEAPDAHLRWAIDLDGEAPSTLYMADARRFGRALVVPRGDYRSLPTLAAMGPEPLGPAFDAAAFLTALRRSSQGVKAHLLSQRPVSGVGNIYADEALWRAMIHPLTPSSGISAARAMALHQAIREVLTEALAAQGTTLNDYRTVNGEVGAYLRELKAYGHDGEPCPRCGTVMRKLVVAGRGTHLCPRCQRLPRSRGEHHA